MDLACCPSCARVLSVVLLLEGVYTVYTVLMCDVLLLLCPAADRRAVADPGWSPTLRRTSRPTWRALNNEPQRLEHHHVCSVGEIRL